MIPILSLDEGLGARQPSERDPGGLEVLRRVHTMFSRIGCRLSIIASIVVPMAGASRTSSSRLLLRRTLYPAPFAPFRDE